jgi:hypothetical protein
MTIKNHPRSNTIVKRGNVVISHCMLCGEEEGVRHIDLYVIGSEGLWVCHACEMKVVEYVRGLMHQRLEAKIQAYLDKETT